MHNYVRSRGLYRKHEYTWIKDDHEQTELGIVDDEEFTINSNDPKAPKNVRITNFRDQSTPALIVFRDEQKFLLFISGIKADWTVNGASIYHSIAWVANAELEPNEEKNIRRLIIRTLQGDLQNNISSVIESDPENKLGFKVDFNKLKQIEEDETFKLGDDDNSFDSSKKIGNNINNLKDELVAELKQSCLPKDEGFLIVVSNFVADQLLKDVKVWRGLSSRIPGEIWEVYEGKKKPQLAIPLLQPQKTRPLLQPQKTRPLLQPQKTPQNRLIFLLGIAVVILIVIIITYTYMEVTGQLILKDLYPQQHQQRQIPFQNKS